MKQRSNRRKNRFEELILQEVSSFLRRSSFFHTGLPFLSITAVEMSPDLSNATIFWDTFDATQESKIEEIFLKRVGSIRKHLAHVIKSRRIPYLKFQHDIRFSSQKKIENLLREEENPVQ